MALKYSFMSFSCPEATLAEMLALASKYGYDAVEPRIQERHQHGIELEMSAAARREARRQAADAGVALGCIATSCRYADPQTTDAQVEDTLRAIDLAADLGAARIRVFGGKIGGGLSRADAVLLVAEALRRVAARAQQRSVIVCMETHDDWCNPQDVAAVMRLVNHPAIGVNWDIMHPVRMGYATMDEAFATLRPWIHHAHVHDGVVTAQRIEYVPIGTGAIDHRRAVELLATTNYGDYVSGEWISWEPAEVHLPRELATLKEYERQAAVRR